jgi:hypothetical protein
VTEAGVPDRAMAERDVPERAAGEAA